MKEKGNPVLISKIEIEINLPLTDVAYKYHHIYYQAGFNKNFSCVEWYQNPRDETNSIIYGHANLPLPFQNRFVYLFPFFYPFF